MLTFFKDSRIINTSKTIHSILLGITRKKESTFYFLFREKTVGESLLEDLREVPFGVAHRNYSRLCRVLPL